MRERDPDVMRRRWKILVGRISLCLDAGHYFEFERLTSSEIDNGFIRSLAPFPNLIEVIT